MMEIDIEKRDEECLLKHVILNWSDRFLFMSHEGSIHNPFSVKEPKDYVPKHISEAECHFEFITGGGKGGQKVNKTASTAVLYWNMETSPTFNTEEKGRIRLALATRITKKGDIIIRRQSERSQIQNKQEALEDLNTLIAEVLKPVKERVEGAPTKGSQLRRLDGKTRESQKKKQRGESFDRTDDG